MPQGINTYNEGPLHAALKCHYAQMGDRLEIEVAGFIVDIVRDDLLIEIQTRNFSALKRKLKTLVKQYRVLLVYPIASEKWIIKQSVETGEVLSRRKSPKRGQLSDIFSELVHIPQLLANANFSLEVVFIQEEEVRVHDPKRAPRRAWRRRGWITEERRLLNVVACERYESPTDFARTIPADLPALFSTANLAQALGCSRRLAQKAAYCWREMGLIDAQDKAGNAILYARVVA